MRLNKKARCFDCVDKKNIGAFGMSFGGSVALDLAHECDSIKASANLDGFFYSSNWERAIKKPVLLMQHDGIGGLFLLTHFKSRKRCLLDNSWE